jgi:HB1, ASXL, restriction endonuclease HTH domain
MASKKKTETATAKAPKLKGAKAKEFLNIADALTKPLGETPAEAKTEAGDGKGVPKAEAKKAKTKKEKKPKKVGALDAAARVLQEAGEPMGCKEMIDAMASKGYWSSPNGQTPHATLYAAILREMKVKGKEARFIKSDRGKFAIAK